MSSTASTSAGILPVLRLLRAEADYRIVAIGLGTALAVMASGALAALAPLALKSLVDAVTSSSRGTPGIALTFGTAYLFLLLAGRVLADIRPLLTGTISQRLHRRLSLRFFDHVLRLPMAYLVRRPGGELLHCRDLAAAGAQLVVAHLASSLLPVLVELFTMTAVLVHLGQPRLVAVFGIASMAYLGIFSVGAHKMKALAHGVSASSLEVHAQLAEGIAHLETLRCCAAEAQAKRRLQHASVVLESRCQGLERVNTAIATAASATFAAAMAACLHIATDAVDAHTMTVGGFVMATVYMLQMTRPLESLGYAARDFSRAVGYLRPLLDVLAETPSEDASACCEPAPFGAPYRRAPSVRLENLHFGYHPDRPVLRGLDLVVPAGSTTAIVGRSGSGKSSLARLLMRLYVPQQGRILLDGRPIDSIDVGELRRTLVGMVPQETALLHETIAENIALGTPTASLDDIRIAARGAQLEELIDALPDGLGTRVGERGMQLSGGERQRVGIARALLRQPGLYLLDEPTSMLDSRTEREIQDALRALPRDATTIVIAHRLSTIAHADEIVVLDEGRIRERGSHRSLLAMNGLYAQMWRHQMAGAG